MKGFLFSVIVLTAAVLVVAAVVFRSGRARNTLRFLRNAAWLYIAGIVALTLWQIWRNGL
ncbi:MAG: hypothetical protein M0R74_08775 [Dehalococcoidia bacterium]|nr:hypothetical protein [Dehalococcoidia bacterium]